MAAFSKLRTASRYPPIEVTPEALEDLEVQRVRSEIQFNVALKLFWIVAVALPLLAFFSMPLALPVLARVVMLGGAAAAAGAHLLSSYMIKKQRQILCQRTVAKPSQ